MKYNEVCWLVSWFYVGSAFLSYSMPKSPYTVKNVSSQSFLTGKHFILSYNVNVLRSNVFSSGLVWFYGISTTTCLSISNPVYT